MAGWIYIFINFTHNNINMCGLHFLAGGDSDVALGHATLSNLLAIVWVPLIWLIYYKERRGMLGIYSIEGRARYNSKNCPSYYVTHLFGMVGKKYFLIIKYPVWIII